MVMGIGFYLIPIAIGDRITKLELALNILLCKVSQPQPFSAKFHKCLNKIMMKHLIFEMICQRAQKRN